MQVNMAGIAEELQAWQRWVIWQKVQCHGIWAKIPKSAGGSATNTKNGTTWNTLEEVLASKVYADGIGFVLTDSPFVGIDIDDCMDGGRMERKALAIVKRFGSYAELSPSGNGLHIIGRGKAVFPDNDGRSPWGRRSAGLMGFKSFEVYNQWHYLTVTGNTIAGYEHVRDVQDVLDRMTTALWNTDKGKQGTTAQKKKPTAEPTATATTARCYNDAFLVRMAKRGKRGKWFVSLYEQGDMSRYCNDHSRADMALLSELAFWTSGNAEQMARIFSASALGKREKWQTRQDYRTRTIDAVLRHWNGKGYKKG